MKGKYAARAALRREDQGVRSELESYQHNVRRLTEENRLLKEQVRLLQATHKAETRKLRAQLDEGLSPELLALREELRRQRERAAQAESARKTDLESRRRLTDFTIKLLHDITGCTLLEAMEAVARALGASFTGIVGQGAGANLPEGGDPEVVASLQRVRGYRSNAKVVEHLDALCMSAGRGLGKSTSERKLDRWREA